MKVCALTTVDNPYSYFNNRDEWEAYENATGMRATSMLGRFAFTSNQLSVQENEAEIERAIDEIIKYDPLGVFAKETTTLERIWS